MSSPDPTRFEQELELVTLLPHPGFLAYLASTKTLTDPAFVAYLNYLQYWAREPYVRYLSHPGPTLKALELLQTERFRAEILRPEVLNRWADGLMLGAAGVEGWNRGGEGGGGGGGGDMAVGIGAGAGATAGVGAGTGAGVGVKDEDGMGV